jgi:class 3 adenylate cyclase
VAEHEVRYCTTEDGVRIAYCVEGEGAPILLLWDFLGGIALEHLFPALEDFNRDLAAGRRAVKFDGRGTGLSQRQVVNVSPSALIGDIVAVVQALDGGRVAVWSPGLASQTAIRFAATHPEMVSRLILYAPLAGPTDIMTAEALRGYAELSRADWNAAAQTMADLSHRQQYPEAGTQLGSINKQVTSGDMIARIITEAIGNDVRPLLSSIACPTLVLHRQDDSIFPSAIGQEIAAKIPNARFIPLRGAIHYHALDDPESVLQAVHSFLDEDPETRRRLPAGDTAGSSEGPLRTIIFTDVVENTALLQRIGDDGWRSVMREHDEIVRAALKEHGGTEISTSGDGFFASFGSSVRALQCAVEMQRGLARRNETAEHPIEVRIGLNAGEPIEEGKDVLGTAVTMAARIMSQAGAGEVLVSDVVRQLVAGKGFLFTDRGEFVAKGFEEPVRVYEVAWRQE